MLKEMSFYNQIAFVLVLVGGIFWGFVGLFDVQILTVILGSLLSRLIYIAVGAAAGWLGYQIYVEMMKKA